MKRGRCITNERVKRRKTFTSDTTQQETYEPNKVSLLLGVPADALHHITAFMSKADILSLYTANTEAQKLTPLGAFNFPYHVFIGRVNQTNRFDNSTDKIRSITGFYGDINQLSQSQNLTCLAFSADFNDRIAEGVLPVSLKQLTFGFLFNQPIGEGVLPGSLTHLTFGSSFNHPVSVGVLPDSLTHLIFGFVFNRPMGKGVLSARLTRLTFGYEFNQPLVKDVLPPHLTHLTFGYEFNQPLAEGVLPACLLTLTFGCDFNQPIGERVMPASLSQLTFGREFNHIITTRQVSRGTRCYLVWI
jgi:hypothetical protein